MNITATAAAPPIVASVNPANAARGRNPALSPIVTRILARKTPGATTCENAPLPLDNRPGVGYNNVITIVKKVIRVGNSAGILLSRDDLARSGFSTGAALTVRVRPGRIELHSIERKIREVVSDRFAALVDEFVERYRGVFTLLATE